MCEVPNMLSNLFHDLVTGHQYSKKWPVKPQLYAIFPECRVIKATHFAVMFLPVIAIISFCIQVAVLGYEFMPQALAMACLILSMPLQGYYWLGKRAQQPLPMSLVNWYGQLENKLLEQGVSVKSNSSKLRYLDMALLLNLAFKELEKGWWKEWF